MKSELKKQYKIILDKIKRLDRQPYVDKEQYAAKLAKIKEFEKQLKQIRKEMFLSGEPDDVETLALMMYEGIELYYKIEAKKKITLEAAIKKIYKKYNIDSRLLYFISLTFRWVNDICWWADDVLSGKIKIKS